MCRFTYIPNFGEEVKVHLDDKVNLGGANSFSCQMGLDLIWSRLCPLYGAWAPGLPLEPGPPQPCPTCRGSELKAEEQLLSHEVAHFVLC